MAAVAADFVFYLRQGQSQGHSRKERRCRNGGFLLLSNKKGTTHLCVYLACVSCVGHAPEKASVYAPPVIAK